MPASDISHGPRRLRWRAGAAALLAFGLVQPVVTSLVTARPAYAAGPVTYQDQRYPSSVTAPTADKPQSKVWHHGGAWWGLLISAAKGVPSIHQLRSDHTWRDTGVAVDTRPTSTSDALSTSGKLYVASGAGGGAYFSRYTYDSSHHTYIADPGFPVRLVAKGTESVSIARDGTGKIWATFTQAGAVWVTHTTTSDATWKAPARVPNADTTVSSDDISGIVAFSHAIGIMWSDQQSSAFRFAIHADGASDSSWRVETPLSGESIADDHMNLKSIGNDAQGRVFAVVKTSYDDAGKPSTSPLIIVVARSSSGAWKSATAATIADRATRPQIALDGQHGTIYVLMTAPVTGGTIYYKSAALSSLSFPTGRGAVFMSWSGAVLNNVSTTKDPVDSSTGIVAIASDDVHKRYYHAELPLG